VAVLIMIEAHVFDSWTRYPDNRTREFAYAMILGGFGAPLFLFLAGVVVPLSAGSKLRKTNDVGAATVAVAKRGLQIFGLAFLFRAQAWILGWANPRDLLRVDILNIMGPSMIAAAAIWALARSTTSRIVLFAIATLATVIASPLLRVLPGLAVLPDPIEAYVRPTAPFTHFVLFPWSAFVFAGALIGCILDAARTMQQERRVNIGFAAAGIAIAFVAYQASFRPSVLPAWYPPSNFWTTSASFFLIRAGLIVAAIGAAWMWESRSGAVSRWSPMRQFGRTSLFIYWIHVELVYGFFTWTLRKSLSWGSTWIAYVAFVVLMLGCSLAKDRVVAWWTRGRVPVRPASAEVEIIRS
jgi:uncharacterized membrane protein